MLDKKEFLNKYEPQTKVIALECMDGAEVKIKKLSVSQRQEVNDVMFGDAKFASGSKKMEVEVTRYNKASKLGVAYGLIEPRLSVSELDKLSEDVTEFINEVFSAIQEFDVPKK